MQLAWTILLILSVIALSARGGMVHRDLMRIPAGWDGARGIFRELRATYFWLVLIALVEIAQRLFS